MKLSEHFSLEELTASSTATRLGIDNSATPDEITKLQWLAGCLEPVRALLGPLHVDSAKRCLELNRALKSKDTSQHVKCEAADLKSLAGLTPSEMCHKVMASDIPYDQVILEFDEWMHLSFTQGEPRHMALTIDASGTRVGIK